MDTVAAVELAEIIAGVARENPQLDLRPLAKLLLVPPQMAHLAPKMILAHQKELLQRYVAGQDLRPATHAEMLVALMELSFRTPVNKLGGALYLYCFEQVMGPADYLFPDNSYDLAHARRGNYKDEVELELAALRRQMAVKTRKAA